MNTSKGKGANGSGSIYQTASQVKSGKWTVDVSLSYLPNGKRERVRKTAPSKREAQRLLTQLLHSKETGTLSKASTHTVRTYGEYWVRDVQVLKVRPTTASGYEDLLRRYVFPMLGSIRLIDLRATHIEDLLSHLRRHKLSASTVNQVRRILFGMCKHAQRMGIIHNNPVASTETVKKQQNDKSFVCKPWTKEEVAIVLREAQFNDQLDCFLHLMLHTGIRPGEAMGLRWQDVDFEKKLIHITGTLKQERRLTPSGEGVVRLVRNEPKTLSSRRSIQISEALEEALLRQLMRQGIREVTSNEENATPVYVVTSQTGTPVNPSNIRRIFNSFLKLIHIRRIRLHDIRHTVANLGLQHDIPIEVLSQAFGHTRIDTTKQIYAGNVPRYTERFVQGISEVLPKVEKTLNPTLEIITNEKN